MNTKILHVLNRSVPNTCGYSIRSKYIVHKQRALCFDPTVVTSPRHSVGPETRESIDGVSYFRTAGDARSLVARLPGIRHALDQRVIRARVAEVAGEVGCELIHAHSPVLCGNAGWSVARRLGIPLVYEIRALWEDAAVDQGKCKQGSLRYRLTRGIETRLLKRADAIVVICEGLRQDIVDRGIASDRVFVVPNGVDASVFTPRHKNEEMAEKLGVSGKKVIGFIGSFYRFEGVPCLVKAFVQLAKERDDTCLLLVGDGEDLDVARALADESGLADRIVFCGRVPHETIMDYYSIADAMVYPRLSRRITELVTPLKPLEAMAMEIPVVVSNVGGLIELVRDGDTGLSFRAGDPVDLARVCADILDDPAVSRRLVQQARASVQKERSWDQIVKRYRSVYERARKHAMS